MGAKKSARRKTAQPRTARTYAAKNKTIETRASVASFLAGIENPRRKADARTVAKLLRSVTGEKPRMWGSSIVGYGSYHYKYDSGREGDGPCIGFAPRKQSLVLYFTTGFKSHAPIMKKLGKHKIGSSCLYLSKLDDIDLDVLERLTRASWDEVNGRYPR